MNEIVIDTWLYGSLADYGGSEKKSSFAHLEVHLPEGSNISDLLSFLKMPSEARGITFINGNLSAMPGVQPDLDHTLQDQDRVAFFDPISMWPFQYRHGIAMIEEMAATMESSEDMGVHHSYEKDE